MTDNQKKLTPINAKCAACGRPATFGLVVQVALGLKNFQVETTLRFCATCQPSITGAEPAHLPTHERFTLTRGGFPPKRGEIFLDGNRATNGGLVIGCPKCGGMVGLRPETHKLVGSEIKPSYICPVADCGLHVWLSVEPESGKS